MTAIAPAGRGSGSAGLSMNPTDTTSKAVRGGVYVQPINAEPAAFDVITGSAPDVPHPARVYSRIIKYQAYKYPDAGPAGNRGGRRHLVGDLARRPDGDVQAAPGHEVRPAPAD